MPGRHVQEATVQRAAGSPAGGGRAGARAHVVEVVHSLVDSEDGGKVDGVPFPHEERDAVGTAAERDQHGPSKNRVVETGQLMDAEVVRLRDHDHHDGNGEHAAGETDLDAEDKELIDRPPPLAVGLLPLPFERIARCWLDLFVLTKGRDALRTRPVQQEWPWLGDRIRRERRPPFRTQPLGAQRIRDRPLARPLARLLARPLERLRCVVACRGVAQQTPSRPARGITEGIC